MVDPNTTTDTRQEIWGPTPVEMLPAGEPPAEAFVEGIGDIAAEERQEVADDTFDRIIAAAADHDTLDYAEGVRVGVETVLGLQPLPDKPEEGEA